MKSTGSWADLSTVDQFLALIFIAREHQRLFDIVDCKAHRPGVDSPDDGHSIRHFSGALSKVWCLLLFLTSRKAWRSMHLAGLLAVSKGREIHHLETTDTRDHNI